MPSGSGGYYPNQLKGKDEIEDDPVNDPVNLVRTRSSDPSNAPYILEELKHLPGDYHPSRPSETATRILPPVEKTRRSHHYLGPQPANSLHKTRNQGSTPSRKRESIGSTVLGSSDIRPRKQQKTSVMEHPSVDTDDEPMEVDSPHDRGNKTMKQQGVRKQNTINPEDIVQHRNTASRYSPADDLRKQQQMSVGLVQQRSRKNGSINSITRLADSKQISRAELDLAEDVDGIQLEKRSTHSTYIGVPRNNDSSKWTYSSGDITPTKWTNTKKQSPRQPKQKPGPSGTKINLLCFQCGIDSVEAKAGAHDLFIQVLPHKGLKAVLVGQREWEILLAHILSIQVYTSGRKFEICQRRGSWVPERHVVFTLEDGEDVDKCKTLITKYIGYRPKEKTEKYFDGLANKLNVWKEKYARLIAEPLEATSQNDTHQGRGKTQKISIEIPVPTRRSTRNRPDKAVLADVMEIVPSKRSRDSSTDEFEGSLGDTRSSKMPKLELPKPRWKTSLVYPPTGPKREIVDYDDLSRLNSYQFLNDNIVNFYLRYIEVRLQKQNPELAKETYFLNTFFYERLTKKDEKGKRREIDSVLKWTAKVDIFKTSYIVVPINESSHWYLAIICNLCHLERKMRDKVSNSPQSKSIDLESGKIPAEAKEDDQGMTLENTLATKAKSASHGGEKGDVEIIGARDSLLGMVTDEEQLKEVENLESHDEKDANESHSREVIELDQSSFQRLLPKGKGKPRGKGRSKVKEKSPQKKKNCIPPDTPTIIILDSMGFGGSSHAQTIKNLREYLAVEALNKRNLEITKDDIKATYAKAPNQNNWYDCGLFLLHYVERFLDRPKDFATMFLAKEDHMRDPELWRKEEIKGMREKLFHLFIELHDKQEAAEMEQKGVRIREDGDNNEDTNQMVEDNDRPAKDVMALEAETPTKDKDMKKAWITSKPGTGNNDIGFEKFTHELDKSVASGREENTFIDKFAIQPSHRDDVEGMPNSILNHREVTLSVRENQ